MTCATMVLKISRALLACTKRIWEMNQQNSHYTYKTKEAKKTKPKASCFLKESWRWNLYAVNQISFHHDHAKLVLGHLKIRIKN